MFLQRIFLALLLWTWASLAPAQEFVAVPPLSARVTDLAGMLKPEERSRLEAVLKEHEDRTGNQVAVLLVKSTAPESIEQYSIRVADQWKLGRKGVDDGVILLVARDNPPALRRLRIEAGRGVQGSLTDAQSKRILQDVIAPHFRQEDYYGGLAAGVAAIHAAVDRENLPGKQADSGGLEGASGLAGLLPFIFFLVIILIIRSRMRSARLNAGGWGRSAGVILGSGMGWGTRGDLGGRGPWIGGGGFGGGGFGGGSGGGGGGFSGGGGGFDGGGASGNW